MITAGQGCKKALDRSAWLLGLGACLAAGACTRAGAKPVEPEVRPVARQADTQARGPAPAAGPAVPARAPSRPRAGQEITIPAGVVHAGSPSGSPHRNPTREADQVPIALASFSMDALPYPNDPAVPARTLVSRSEASSACAEQGKRLCSELEWERACEGEAGLAHPSDGERCARDPGACPSAFGVFGLGTSGREWTSSDATSGLGDALRTAVVRGATSDAPAALHRCSARDAATPESKSEGLTFRCCRGPESALAYPTEPERPAFAEREVSRDELRALLRSMPETTDIADQFRLFRGEELARSLQRQGRSRAGLAPWQATHKPIWWSPLRGEQVGVLAGDTPRGALLILYYPQAGGAATFAGSYETQDEHEPLLIAYKPDTPGEVLFSTCWGCGGEGGALSLGDDARVRIAQR